MVNQFPEDNLLKEYLHDFEVGRYFLERKSATHKRSRHTITLKLQTSVLWKAPLRNKQ